MLYIIVHPYSKSYKSRRWVNQTKVEYYCEPCRKSFKSEKAGLLFVLQLTLQTLSTISASFNANVCKHTRKRLSISMPRAKSTCRRGSFSSVRALPESWHWNEVVAKLRKELDKEMEATHTHITDNRKKPIEFTLQNHEFWRKKPRMRIDYKKVMKANLLDFFESVRICGWRWRHHPRNLLTFTWQDQMRRQCSLVTKMPRRKRKKRQKCRPWRKQWKKNKKRRWEFGIFGCWFVISLRAILIDNVWLDMIFGDFTEIFHL